MTHDEAETCRYLHTADELRLVVRVLESMNAINETDELGLEGSLDLFWADTIMGRIVWDHTAEEWVYLPTAKGEKPEEENDDAALTELETLQTVLDVLPRLWMDGHVTKEQDGEWWLFDSRGEGVVGGGSFHELCINIKAANL